MTKNNVILLSTALRLRRFDLQPMSLFPGAMAHTRIVGSRGARNKAMLWWAPKRNKESGTQLTSKNRLWAASALSALWHRVLGGLESKFTS